MASMKDMARSMAAGSSMEGAGMGLEPTPETAPEGAPAMDPAADLEAGISMVEGALEALAPEAATKARSHLEALREIAVEAQAGSPAASEPSSGEPSADTASPLGAELPPTL